MLIDLQEPFKSLWRKGYLQHGADGRARVHLYNSDDDRSGMSYARYLKSVELGYIVPDEFEVDHKNDDRSDDRPDNLQLLTPLENRAKEYLRKAEEIPSYGYYCAACGSPFLVDSSDHAKRQLQGNENHYCSRRCYASGIQGSSNSKSEAEILQIRKLRSAGNSSYQIASIMGISRNTVMKHW